MSAARCPPERPPAAPLTPRARAAQVPRRAEEEIRQDGPVTQNEDDNKVALTNDDSASTSNAEDTSPKKETEWKPPAFGVHPFYIGIDNSEISGAGTTSASTTEARKAALDGNSTYYPGLVDRLEAAGCLYPSAHRSLPPSAPR